MSEPLDRLYDLLPVIYRQRDAALGEPLRALLRVLAEQVQIVEDDIAQLYENWFIETCQDWVVPYIGDLIDYQVAQELGDPGDIATAEGLARNQALVPRREVANTIRYRRRKGTLALLELLAQDVAGWPARAVQFYPLLGLAQGLRHTQPMRGRILDLRDGAALDLLGGPFDQAAHTVDIRRPGATPDRGWFDIASVGLFVWRLNAYSVTRAPAYCVEEVGAHCFTFSVLGNDSQLYTRPAPEPAPTHIAEALNLPIPIRRRALEGRLLDYYGPDSSFYIWVGQQPTPAPTRRQLRSQRPQPVVTLQPVPADQIVVADLTDWAYRPRRGQVAVDPVLGRIAFPPNAAPANGVWVTYHYGFSADMGGGEYDRPISAPPDSIPGFWLFRLGDINDPAHLLDDLGNPDNPLSHYLFDHLAATTRDLYAARDPANPPSDALLQAIMRDLSGLLADDQLYAQAQVAHLTLPPAVEAGLATQPQGPDLIRLNRALLEAAYTDSIAPAYIYYAVGEGPGEYRHIREALARWQRDQPRHAVIEITDSGAYTEQIAITLRDHQQLQLRAANRTRPVIRLLDWQTSQPDALVVSGGTGSCFTLDGLLVTGREMQVEGELAGVTIRHSTLVPGWGLEHDCTPRRPVEPSLELVNTDARIVIEHSILGSIQVIHDEVTREPVTIRLSDSILDATSTQREALGTAGPVLAHAVLTVARCTVFGQVMTHAIDLAENSIFDGRVQVGRRQRGCMRFCYVTPGSRTPRRYHCQPDGVAGNLTGEARTVAERRVLPQFNSVRYGTPTYCQLAASCAVEITHGADDESEMGVFHDLFQPQREANLRARLADYTPAGTDAGLIFAS